MAYDRGITKDKLTVWAGGLGGGKVATILTNLAEANVPELANYYFKELVGLIGGPAAVALAWKMSARRPMLADLLGLAGIEMFIDRLAKVAGEQLGFIASPGPQAFLRAPPPGTHPTPGHWPYATQQRLPFQSDLTW